MTFIFGENSKDITWLMKISIRHFSIARFLTLENECRAFHEFSAPFCSRIWYLNEATFNAHAQKHPWDPWKCIRAHAQNRTCCIYSEIYSILIAFFVFFFLLPPPLRSNLVSLACRIIRSSGSGAATTIYSIGP